LTSVLTETTKKKEEEAEEIFDRKLELVIAGLRPQFYHTLKSKLKKDNAKKIMDYILAMKTEINLSDYHRESIIRVLGLFCCSKNFKEVTREDVLEFLDRRRKPESLDPLHKWIGTYNSYLAILSKFFKWLYYPDIEPHKRPRPPVIENITQLKRKEQSIYTAGDLWTVEDDFLFLKYCPSARDRCYHMMARDLSCRPHEILKLKVKDIMFKSVGNKQYAEVVVNGKTRSRPLPLINSIPYIKDWLDEHPQRGNSNAFLIISRERSNFGKKITEKGLNTIYTRTYRMKFFPKLLQDPNIPQEDKQNIMELLKKPWNPYILRHSSLTEKSKILKEHILRQHAGWSIGSSMPQRYLHYFGNESNASLLEAYGIVPKDQRPSDVLNPKQCPNCSEPNKPDSRFCIKCRMVLTYDAYNEAIDDKQQEDDALATLSDQVMKLMAEVKELKNQS
jgi:integrase